MQPTQILRSPVWRVCLLMALTAFSCAREASENVNQDTVFGEYRLVYDAGEDKTYARATFRFGGPTGTILELTDPAAIVFAGDPLSWRPLLAYYEKSYAGLGTPAAFTYDDLDGNSFVNSVEMAKSIAFPAGLDSIGQSSAYALSWEGDPVSAGESVIVTINGINEGDAKIFTTTEIGATSIILDKDKLEGIGLGTGRIVMERWTTQLLQEGTSKGGAVWSRYITALQEVEIVE